MSCLAEKISDQTAKLEKFKSLYSELFKQTKWDEETNFPKLDNFLCIIELLDNEILDPEIQKAKRILLFEKAKCLLPHGVLQMIEEKIEEQGVRIKTILKHSHQKINLHEGIPKLTILINHEEWFVEDIEWGITNQVIFQALAVEQWYQFPTMIKTMLSYLVRNLKWGKYFTFWITSSVGWRAKKILPALSDMATEGL
jgi:hypothetical protein